MKNICFTMKISKILNSSGSRYVVVGAVAYLIDFSSFVVTFKLGLSEIGANIVGKVNGGIFGFFAHRHFTFKVKHGLKINQAIRYFAILAVYAPFSSLVLKLVMYIIHYSILAKFISDVICIILSYLLTKYIVFMKKHQNIH
ncbi:MAG TPA: GtrA family protein [Aquella sp.]|nr:GtrA family protein [Aquella sp.]